MPAQALEEQTFIPDEDRESLASVFSFLAAHERLRDAASKPDPSYALVGVDEHDRIELPAERVGTRHRLRLDDVLAYRETRRRRQYDALAAMEVDIDTEGEPAKVREQLREVRRLVAERRRKAKG